MKQRQKNQNFAKVVNGKYQLPRIERMFAREGDPPAGDPPKALDETAVNRIVHSAISSRLTSDAFKESIGAIVVEASKASSAEMTTSIVEQVTKALGDKGGSGDPPGDSPTPSFKDSDEYKSLMQRDSDREAAHKKMSDEREAEKSAGLRKEEKDLLTDSLRKAGVDEGRLRGCVSALINDDKVIHRSGDNIVYRFQRDGYVDDKTVEDGVKEYLDSDEGKSYLPSSGASGTGSVGNSENSGNNNPGPGKKMTKEQAGQTVTDWLGQGSR